MPPKMSPRRRSSSSAVPTRPSAITSATGAVVLRDRLSQPVVPTVTRDRAATSSITGAGPIVTLTADEVFETEVLQIMRVRMPLEALQAFGVPLPESEAWRVVDVDVLVGADGLAREIRQIRSVVDADAQGFGR